MKTEVNSWILEQPIKIDNYLIVDDIIDGGRTFIELSKELVRKGIDKSQINLYVTHGIFSKGFTELDKHFNKVYCHNVWPDALSDFEFDARHDEIRNHELLEIV